MHLGWAKRTLSHAATLSSLPGSVSHPSSAYTSREQLGTGSTATHSHENQQPDINLLNLWTCQLFWEKKQTKRQPWTGLLYFFVYFVICKFVQTYKWFYSPETWFLRLPLGPETVFGILNCNVFLKPESTLLHRSACKFVEPQIFEAASIIFILYF